MNAPKPLSEAELRAMAQRLLDEIEAAFEGVSIESGVTLEESVAIDNHRSEEECAEIRARCPYTRWQEVVVDPDAGVGGLCFFDPIGFRFHLPAYMDRYIRMAMLSPADYGEGGERIVSNLMIDGERSRKQASLLDEAQRRCCAHFLVYNAEAWYFAYHTYDFPRRDSYLLIDSTRDQIRILRTSWWAYLDEAERELAEKRWPAHLWD